LNYLETIGDPIYAVIQNLCIGRFMNAPHGFTGVTFLLPDSALTNQLISKATSDNPDEVDKAANIIRECILYENLKSINDFKNGEIPNSHRRVLMVQEVNNKNVELVGGGIVTPDPNFLAAKSKNISVYKLSKAFPETSTRPYDVEENKVKKEKSKAKKMGGGDIKDVENRTHLVEKIVIDMFSNRDQKNYNSAMELLIEMHKFFSNNNNAKVVSLIESFTSFNSLASLVLILQPYKNSDYYLEDSEVKAFIDHLNKYGNYKDLPMYTFDLNPVSYYNKMMDNGANKNATFAREVENAMREGVNANKPTSITILNKLLKGLLSKKPDHRSNNMEQVKAEAELFVVLTLLLQNEVNGDSVSVAEINYLLKQFDLNNPYYCANADNESAKSSNIAFYYSLFFEILRSGFMYYVPGIKGDIQQMSGIAQNSTINVDATYSKLMDERTQNSLDRINALRSRITGQL
jgi:hypothetical protein